MSAEEVESLAQEVESLEVTSSDDAQSVSPVLSAKDEADAVQVQAEEHEMAQYEQHEEKYYNHADDMHQDSQHRDYFVAHPRNRSYSPFQYNKRQTGKKNISSIVVGDDDKMEFDQKEDRGFGVIKINRPIGTSTPHRDSYDNMNDTESNHSEQTHTADGFFDLKFYSHPLW